MKSVLFLFFLILSNNSYCNKVDSLILLIPKVEDGEKIQVLNDLCWELKYTDQQRSSESGLEAIR